MELRGLHRPPQHLRSEARASHAEQDDIGQAVRCNGVGELPQSADVLSRTHGLVEPSEPPVLAGRRPERRVAGPDPRCELDGAGSGHWRPLGGGELRAGGADAVEQLGEGIGELLDAFALERQRHVVVVDASGRKALEHRVRLVDVTSSVSSARP